MSSFNPDILAKDLAIVFCGINPAATAVTDGHSFSHRSNRFWKVVYLANFTPRLLKPDEERSLLDFGCGLTAAVTRPTTSANQLTRGEIAAAAPALEEKIRSYAPRTIAFLGKVAYSAISGRRNLSWGRQPERFGGAAVWVLPNPSGLNRSFQLDALVTAFAELRKDITRF